MFAVGVPFQSEGKKVKVTARAELHYIPLPETTFHHQQVNTIIQLTSNLLILTLEVLKTQLAPQQHPLKSLFPHGQFVSSPTVESQYTILLRS